MSKGQELIIKNVPALVERFPAIPPSQILRIVAESSEAICRWCEQRSMAEMNGVAPPPDLFPRKPWQPKAKD